MALTRYAKDMALIAKRFEVGVSMDYNKQRDELKITCKGRSSQTPVQPATIFCSIMSAAIILGARQDQEWKPLMQKAYAYMESDPDKTNRIMQEIAQLQLNLANEIRIHKARQHQSKMQYNLHMEMGL